MLKLVLLPYFIMFIVIRLFMKAHVCVAGFVLEQFGLAVVRCQCELG